VLRTTYQEKGGIIGINHLFKANSVELDSRNWGVGAGDPELLMDVHGVI
jgi:hypothetical protein